MKHIVILEDSSNNFWLIVDQFYVSCPQSPVLYTNTVNHPKVEIKSTCENVQAKHAATGAITDAKAVEI